MTDAPAPGRSHADLGNTRTRYGTVTKTFHWSVALGILVMIPLGIVANDWPYATSEELAFKATLFSIHKTLGVTILFVALARIAWAVAQPKPGPLHPERRLETTLADTVHWLLYASLVLVPLSGWVSHAASQGFAPIRWPFGQSLPGVPKSESVHLVAASLHVVFERVLVLSLLLHTAGALKHHFWDRDATLRRMWPGRPALPSVAPHHASLAPPLAAVCVLAGAVGVGAALGLYVPEARATETTSEVAAAPAPDAAGWTVEEGTLGLAVTQLGGRVEGSFAAWDATIDFDEEPDAEGRFGTVEARVDVGSLTLGSVTSEALGAEFLDAGTFPEAVFSADILAAPEGSGADHVAEGTLSLRGAEVPVTLPFTLAIENDRAIVEGTAEVDRRDFAIGESYADEGTVGFAVEIPVALEAVRAK